MNKEYLLGKWNEAWNILLPSLEANTSLFENIVDAYRPSPKRAYHNIEHIEFGLRAMDEGMEPDFDQRSKACLILAWLFHDIVYDAESMHNELGSVAFFYDAIKESPLPKADALFVADAICQTAHLTAPSTPVQKLIVDMDLAIWGADEETYDKYAGGIGREYSWVEKEAYNRERKKFLAGYLNGKRIFHTNYFRDKYTARAEANLRREIASLDANK